MAKTKERPVRPVDVVSPILAAAAAQSPTALALRNTRAANNMPSALLDPEAMQRIEQLAAALDAGPPIASPLLAGDVAVETGRQPISGMGWGQGQMNPELEQALAAAGQRTDAAAGVRMDENAKYNLRRSLAAEKAAKIQADAEAAARFEDPAAVDYANDVNSRGAVDPRIVQGYRDRAEDADGSRAAATAAASDRVNLMAGMRSVARKQRMGEIPAGVDPAGILAAIAPNADMATYVDPRTGIAIRNIDMLDKNSQRDLEAVNLRAEADKAIAKLEGKTRTKVAESTNASMERRTQEEQRGATRRTRMEIDAGSALRSAQAKAAEAEARVKAAEATLAEKTGTLSESKAQMELDLAKAQLANQTQMLANNTASAKKDGELAEIARKYDPVPHIADPYEKASVWANDVLSSKPEVKKAVEDWEPGKQIPPDLERFLAYAYTNRDSLYNGNLFNTEEGEFENYVTARFPNMNPDKVQRIAEYFFETRTGKWL